jgi:ribosomal protein S12 methylthiotransferase
MNKPKIALISLGCDKNLVESERILGALGGGGYELVPSEDDADIIIINTCGFIKSAADEAREHILGALDLKASGECRHVIVTGCLVQRYREMPADEFPGVDAFVAETDKVKDVVSGLTGIPAIGGVGRVLSTPPHYAYLKIAEGCDNECSYCAIPLIKGSFRSIPIDFLLTEAQTLASGGVRELIIVAQDTASYGMDLYGEPRIDQLLRELAMIEDIVWLRLMYCYPEHLTEELIYEIANNPKICHYLDIPIQHSDGDVLSRMGRKMNDEGLRGLISRLRAEVPDIILRTTVMAGFPGESKREFQSLLKFLEDTRFDRLGAFAYSREEGTPAYDMTGQLEEKTKEARRDRIMEQQSRISLENMRKHVGKTLRVLVDGWDGVAGVYFCRSYMDCPDVDGLIFVKAKYGRLNPGVFADVVITDAEEYDLYGVLKEN